MENNKDRKYPWHLLRRTALLLNAYLGMLLLLSHFYKVNFIYLMFF